MFYLSRHSNRQYFKYIHAINITGISHQFRADAMLARTYQRTISKVNLQGFSPFVLSGDELISFNFNFTPKAF